MGLLGGKKAAPGGPREIWEEFFRAALRNDWAKSMGFLESLKRLEPGNPQVHIKAGDVLQRMGKADESVSSYHKAASLLDSSEESTKALAIYKIILRLKPGDEKADARCRDILGRMRSAKAPEAPSEGMPAAEEPAAPPETGDEQKEPAPSPADGSKPAGRPRDLREAFAQHPIFSVLTDDEIRYMSKEARHLSFNKGDVVIGEDTQGDSIYVIKKGRVDVTTSVVERTLKLASLGGLAFFGEGGFLTGAPRTATVTASAPLDVMEIPKSLMSEMIIKNPMVLGKLVEILRARASRNKGAGAEGGA